MNTVKDARTLSAGAVLLLAVAAMIAIPATTPTLVADSHESDELVDLMSVINDNYKQLRRTARRKNFDQESIDQVVAMQKAAVGAFMIAPPIASKAAGAEKDEITFGYRKEMAKLIVALMDLEAALEARNGDEAAEMIENLNTLKKEGHDKYVEE